MKGFSSDWLAARQQTAPPPPEPAPVGEDPRARARARAAAHGVHLNAAPSCTPYSEEDLDAMAAALAALPRPPEAVLVIR